MEFGTPRQKSLSLVPQIHQSPNNNNYCKTRSRTASSIILPGNLYPLPSQNYYVTNMQPQNYMSRRTPSNATTSTFASSGILPYRNNSEEFQRSTFSRSSGNSQSTGYVALMRKQKATVWCERAQIEDPRLQAQLKAAKIKATKEVFESPVKHRASISGSGSFSSSNKVAAKIRNHGKMNLVGYNPADLVGGVGGVPLRLSASEVEGCESNEDVDSPLDCVGPHRTNSGRNISQSHRKSITYLQQSVTNSMVGKWAGSATQLVDRQLPPREWPYSNEERFTNGSIHCRDSFAMNQAYDSHSTSSGSGGEKADTILELRTTNASRIAHHSAHNSNISRRQSSNTLELKRKGSVDDKTMTQNTGRLYIANPDAESD